VVVQCTKINSGQTCAPENILHVADGQAPHFLCTTPKSARMATDNSAPSTPEHVSEYKEGEIDYDRVFDVLSEDLPKAAPTKPKSTAPSTELGKFPILPAPPAMPAPAPPPPSSTAAITIVDDEQLIATSGTMDTTPDASAAALAAPTKRKRGPRKPASGGSRSKKSKGAASATGADDAFSQHGDGTDADEDVEIMTKKRRTAAGPTPSEVVIPCIFRAKWTELTQVDERGVVMQLGGELLRTADPAKVSQFRALVRQWCMLDNEHSHLRRRSYLVTFTMDRSATAALRGPADCDEEDEESFYNSRMDRGCHTQRVSLTVDSADINRMSMMKRQVWPLIRGTPPAVALPCTVCIWGPSDLLGVQMRV